MKLSLFCFIFCVGNLFNTFSQPYIPTKHGITGYNINRYNNRPLYINNSNAFVLTGDKPIVRMAQEQLIYGTFMIAVVREGQGKWIHDFDEIRFSYLPGHSSWEISDLSIPGLVLNLDVMPMAETTGMAIRADVKGSKPGDKIVWAFGGGEFRPVRSLSWDLDVLGHPEVLSWGFRDSACKNNSFTLKDDSFILSLPDSTAKSNYFELAGFCSSETHLTLGEASVWRDIPALMSSTPSGLPILKGIVETGREKTIYWAFEAFKNNIPDEVTRSSEPEAAFLDASDRAEKYRERVRINTPDPHLNLMAQSAAAAIDGLYYPPVFHHGAMQWNMRFPGWRTVYGGTMLGWHDRVKAQAKFYISSQVEESDKHKAIASPELQLTQQDENSRFYGRGRIKNDQAFYNMQTQFFDQLIEEWRWSPDSDYEQLLRKALDLHLEWQKDCFDPDGDGLYESYISLWPTDSQWYNGGGTAEETSYAYRGHKAARDMARRAGDAEDENYHNEMLTKIKNAFFEKLWVQEKGHSGSYIEQGANERLHTNPWLYSIFLPVDAGLTSRVQSLESVYYSQWALQNDEMPLGGKRVWTSNWVPGIWSIRECWPGDNYHLALSYFQAGLPDEGWEIMRGAFMHDGFGFRVPGNLGGVQGGTDFGDCVHTFARTLVQGLFGFNPNYPNNSVKICPQFPTDWNDVSIEIPDASIIFNRSENQTRFKISILEKAELDIQIPVFAKRIKSVQANGQEVKWEQIPCSGGTLVCIILPESKAADIIIKTEDPLPCYNPELIEADVSERILLNLDNAEILDYHDPQGILKNPLLKKNTLTSDLNQVNGDHTVILEVMAGECLQWRVFRIKVNDRKGDAEYAAKFYNSVTPDAVWSILNISNNFNADIRNIFKQKYLSPRPNTVSLRIADDGYSPWTFTYWNLGPPEINLSRVDTYLKDHRLNTPQKVPFHWNNKETNVAFTSLWDNYPDKLTFPVNQKGDVIWFLVSGSTNVMQCEIANAVIRLNYEDGTTDSLELVPPVNYWNLCPFHTHAPEPGQASRSDYLAETDTFCMPDKLPEVVQLGDNCRAMLLNIKMRPGEELKSITLETLSQEVVVGLMGATLMRNEE